MNFFEEMQRITTAYREANSLPSLHRYKAERSHELSCYVTDTVTHEAVKVFYEMGAAERHAKELNAAYRLGRASVVEV